MHKGTHQDSLITVKTPLPSEPAKHRAKPLIYLAGMVRFFSRLPMPRLTAGDDPAAMPDFARAVTMLPFAAVVIALPAAIALFALGSLTGLPSLTVAILAIALEVMVTGAMHEDGLADTADGFGGGLTTARKLEIMKDSRIGTYGAAAVGLALLARASLIAALLQESAALAALALVAASAISRMTAMLPLAILPPARPDGVAHTAGRPTSIALIVGLFFSLILTLAALAPFLGLARPTVGVAIAIGTALAMTALADRQIGGQTGDVIGASQQIGTIAFLAALLS